MPSNVYSTVKANLIYIDFKKVNTQSFQVCNNYAKFFTNTIAQTPTAMGNGSSLVGFQNVNNQL
ncbi:MAG: hypothetical protein IPF58_01350 [Saprospirales bacterium]|nr:hypothetical protein [Saprospirales bacterium]